MGLKIGIVGLPNVGKSTIFNALTRTQNAESANYPFCTIEPNKAIVPVPDVRLAKLLEIGKSRKTVQATVEFVDIAGLVKGASRGEGLGNKFLANIREVDAILHVVRCFDDPDVVHVEGSVDPVRDVEIIETELLLADLESIERRVENLTRLARANKDVRPELTAAIGLKEHIEAGGTVASYPQRDALDLQPTLQAMQFLTDKKTIYGANVDEATVTADDAVVGELRSHAHSRGAEVVRICGQMEAELAGLSDGEREEFLASYGISSSGLDRIVRLGYETLGLISFFTVGPTELHAWTVRQGCNAQKAAGEIHTDFERGFIRAQVIKYADFVRLNGEAACKAAGLAGMEGKEYVVEDGDIIHFLFNL